MSSLALAGSYAHACRSVFETGSYSCIIDEGERDWKRMSYDVTFYYVLYVVWAKPFEV